MGYTLSEAFELFADGLVAGVIASFIPFVVGYVVGFLIDIFNKI